MTAPGGPAPEEELERYLRKHLKRFGVDTVRRRLLEDGLDEERVDAALAAAQKKPGAAASRMPYLVFGAAALAAIYLALDFSSKPAGPAEPEEATPAGEAAAGQDRTFIGNRGYALKLPDGYVAVPETRDAYRLTETVHLSPKGTDPSHFSNEGLYGHLGILRLDAGPRRVPEGRAGLETVRASVAASLQARKARFSMRDIQVGELPGLVVTISEPFPQAQAFVVGGQALYVLTGGGEERHFTETLMSLNETARHGRP